jgi:methionyl-tRNA formyltransferase
MNLKVAFLGTPDFVQPIKDALAKHYTLVDSLNEADLAVVAAYGKILTKEELNTPKYGCINVHPSLLPKYRGPSPIQTAILNGDKTSGITIIKVDEEMDHGPILYQESLELSDKDTFDSLSKKMFLRSAEILPEIINKFVADTIEDFVQGIVQPKEQNHSEATFCKLLTKEIGYFDINNPPTPEQLDRMIRAYYPWPTAWTKWKSKIVKFLPNEMMQMEGKKVISLQDFLNGYPDFPLKNLL